MAEGQNRRRHGYPPLWRASLVMGMVGPREYNARWGAGAWESLPKHALSYRGGKRRAVLREWFEAGPRPIGYTYPHILSWP